MAVKIECNRCRLLKLQDQAAEEGKVITKRKSLYSFRGKKGVDIYIHPKSVEIPSNHTFAHNGELGGLSFMQAVLPESDPDKGFEAWLSDIPDKCKCTLR